MIGKSRKSNCDLGVISLAARKCAIPLAAAACLLSLATVPAAAAPASAAPAGTAPTGAAPASAAPGSAALGRAAARAAVPLNQAPRSAIALAFDSTGSGFAFYRGADNAVYLRTFRGRHWSTQVRLGGHIVGAPAAAVARTTVIVAARGTDNRLKLRMMQHGTWSRWTSWGGKLTATPAITGGTDGRIDVFVRGADHALWTRTLRPGGRLTPWTRRGGHLSTGPAVVATGNGMFEVAAAGTDHAVWITSTATRWAWRSVGGHTRSTPAIGYIPQSNGAWVLIRGFRNGLWAKGFGGGFETPWRRIGSKQIIGAPTAAGTRQPTAYMIAAVRDARRVPWITRYPTGTGGWSAFFRAW